MNAYDILYGLEYIDKDLAEKAVNYKRNSLIYLRAVAAACLILVFGVSAVFFGISANKRAELPGIIPGAEIENTSSQSETEPVSTFIPTEAKQDISNITGAYTIDRKEIPDHMSTVDGMPKRPYDYFRELYEEDYLSGFYGTAKNIKTVKIVEGDTTCYLTAFDVEITKMIRNAPKSGTVRVICNNYKSDRTQYPQVELNISENTATLFFVLNKNVEKETGHEEIIEIANINAFDYADYKVYSSCQPYLSGVMIQAQDLYLTNDQLDEIFNNEFPREEEFEEIINRYIRENAEEEYQYYKQHTGK